MRRHSHTANTARHAQQDKHNKTSTTRQAQYDKHKEDGLVGKHVTKYTAQLYDAFGVYYAVLAERAAAVASPAAAAAAAA